MTTAAAHALKSALIHMDTRRLDDSFTQLLQAKVTVLHTSPFSYPQVMNL